MISKIFVDLLLLEHIRNCLLLWFLKLYQRWLRWKTRFLDTIEAINQKVCYKAIYIQYIPPWVSSYWWQYILKNLVIEWRLLPSLIWLAIIYSLLLTTTESNILYQHCCYKGPSSCICMTLARITTDTNNNKENEKIHDFKGAKVAMNFIPTTATKSTITTTHINLSISFYLCLT